MYETGYGAQWLYRACPVLVDGTYHMDMEMHGGREFEVIQRLHDASGSAAVP